MSNVSKRAITRLERVRFLAFEGVLRPTAIELATQRMEAVIGVACSVGSHDSRDIR